MMIRSGIRKSLRASGTILCASVWLLCGWLGVQGQTAKQKAQQKERDEVGKIDADVVINFAAEQMSAQLKYQYIATADQANAIVFFLNPTFHVKKVRCSICQSFDFYVRVKPDPSLIIKLKKPLLKGQRVAIHIEYSGSLKGIYKRDYNFLDHSGNEVSTVTR